MTPTRLSSGITSCYEIWRTRIEFLKKKNKSIVTPDHLQMDPAVSELQANQRPDRHTMNVASFHMSSKLNL